MPPIQSEADLDGELLRSDIPSSDSVPQQTENGNTKNEILSDRGNVTSRDLLDQEQRNAAAAREEHRQLRSGKGKRDMPRIRALEEDLRKANNRIDIQAGKLLRMEQGSILQRVLQQEQQKTIDRIRREDKKAFEAYRAESRQYVQITKRPQPCLSQI